MVICYTAVHSTIKKRFVILTQNDVMGKQLLECIYNVYSLLIMAITDSSFMLRFALL